MRLPAHVLSLPSPLNVLIILGLIGLSPDHPEMAHALLIQIEKVREVGTSVAKRDIP